MSEVTALWERLERWLAAHGELRQLRPPASEAALAAAEGELGIKLPPDLRESLLRHDGVMPDAWPEFFYPMQVANIVRHTRWHETLCDGERLRFLLVADGGDGSHLAMSLENSEHGSAGTLLFFEGEFEGEVYPNWAAFLANTAKGLETGRYVLRDEEYRITEFPNGSHVVGGDNPISYKPLVKVEG